MTPRVNRQWSLRIILPLLALCASIASAVPIKFDIPAQPAAAALQQFVKQSGSEVLFVQEQLGSIRSSAVTGELEPESALSALLEGTGFVAKKAHGGKFVVTRSENEKTGSIEGSVRDESGKPVAGARITLSAMDVVTKTDRQGRFTFLDVPAGPQSLAINAEGMQRTKVTDVTVKPNHRHTLGVITVPAQVAGITQLDDYIVSAKKNDGVIELDPYSVEGRRTKPFVDGNLDIPRSVNDAQPYYVFDANLIEASGAVDVGDFLKQRLTMNAEAYSSVQNFSDGLRGNRSSINLRGLGANMTLVLVNGRRAAGAFYGTEETQTDLNGIPVSAIDRIEILPTSASGIYGGSAVGGVVNVILKKNYRGGELRLTYDNTFDADAPRRSASLSYGTTLEDGKTRLSLNAAWSEVEPLRLGERLDVIAPYREHLQLNRPGHLYSVTSPILGSLPNVTATSSAQTTLTLKNGVVIDSRNTFVAAGTSPNTSLDELYASLAANGGQWNHDYPPTNQTSGRLLGLGAAPETKSVTAALRRQMLPKLEAYAEFSFSENYSTRYVNFASNSFTVPVSAPTNPFTTAVRVRVPYQADAPNFVKSQSRSVSLGATADLPWSWVGMLDYTGSENRIHYGSVQTDFTSLPAALASGVLNPFVDTLLHPPDIEKYYNVSHHRGETTLHHFTLRGTGPLPQLPWGQPRLTAGIEHRIVQVGEQVQAVDSPSNVFSNRITYYFPRESVTDAGYAELSIPLVKENLGVGMRSLELQASGRSEHFEVETGTISMSVNPRVASPVPSYSGFTRDGEPFTASDTYVSKNYTFGLKYEPVAGITLRASRGTAFLPPTPLQLTENPTPSSFPTTVTDPQTNETVQVITRGGGSADLKPQNSVSENIGLIWQPATDLLKGLRLNVEYYRTEQFDYIMAPSAQQILNMENTYADRVTRDASGAVTMVDTSYINLFRLENAGWDVSASYSRDTAFGTIGIHTSHSFIDYIKTQYAEDEPPYDAVGYPSELGAAKYKSNASLTFMRGGISAGWTARYFSSYRQNGSVGGPMHTRHLATGSFWDRNWFTAQGTTRIPSQIYHDAYVGYDWGADVSDEARGWRRWKGNLLSGLSLQFGVRNLFEKVPPLDAYYAGNNYLSPYGDIRLRSYWVTLKKAF